MQFQTILAIVFAIQASALNIPSSLEKRQAVTSQTTKSHDSTEPATANKGYQAAIEPATANKGYQAVDNAQTAQNPVAPQTTLEQTIDNNNAALEKDNGKNPAEAPLLNANKQFEQGQETLDSAYNKAINEDKSIEAEMKNLDKNSAQYAADLAKDQKLDAATGAYQKEVADAQKTQNQIGVAVAKNDGAAETQLAGQVQTDATEQKNVQAQINAAL